LNNQLKAIHELQAIPLDPGIQATLHGVPYTEENSPPARSDAWIPDPHPEEIINQAPDVRDGYIVVPEIPHTLLS
jgi:Asp-tRNA(Asn)/Glu-tRNA(Gln) amidotransferase C subunit